MCVASGECRLRFLPCGGAGGDGTVPPVAEVALGLLTGMGMALRWCRPASTSSLTGFVPSWSSPTIQPGRADACAADRHSLRRAPLPEERALVLIQVPVNLFGPAAQSGL